MLLEMTPEYSRIHESGSIFPVALIFLSFINMARFPKAGYRDQEQEVQLDDP